MTNGRAALLLVDLQPYVVARTPGGEAVLPRLALAATCARAAGYPVVFVTVAFRPGHPDVSPRNRAMTTAAKRGALDERLSTSRPCPELLPQPTDIYVTKRRVGAFAGTDLELVLRSRRVDAVVVAGLTTGGAVLSTVRAAADLDLEVTVLADGCADGDPDVHRLLTDKVFPTQATVTTTKAWVSGLTTTKPARSPIPPRLPSEMST